MNINDLTNQPQFSSHKFSKRNVSLVVAVSLVASLTIKPVRADVLSFLGSSGPFGNIISQLKTVFPELTSVTQWVSKLQNSINDPCQGASILLSTPSVAGWCTATGTTGTSMSQTLSGATGVMGLPDPNEVKKTIAKDVTDSPHTPDVFNTNESSYALDLYHTSDRVTTAINSQTVLSKDGQEQTKKQVDQITETIQTIATASDDAQSATNSQDVLKAIAREIAQQAVLSSFAQVSALNSRTDAAITNNNLSNISDTLDQQKRKEEANSTVDSFMLLNIGAQSNLF